MPLSAAARTEADLKRVNQQLDSAIAGLLQASSPTACQGLLQAAANLLVKIPASATNAAQISLLRGVQSRAQRLQLLLDSAMAFYRGWISAAASHSADYTAEGAWDTARERSVLRFEA